jgi:hypothetical protein
MNKFSATLLLIVATACQTRQVTRIDPATEMDLSGRWNDTDSRKVADQVIFDLFDSELFKTYAKERNRKPVIVVGTIRNKTSEHIDADNFVKKFEFVIHSSGVADLIESSEFRDKLRVERIEQQQGENRVRFNLAAAGDRADYDFSYNAGKGQTLFHTFSSLETLEVPFRMY